MGFALDVDPRPAARCAGFGGSGELPGGSRTAQTRKELVGADDVGGDLRSQFFGAAEFLFFAKTFPESNFYPFWCRGRLSVEQVCFDAKRGTIEGGAHADVSNGAMAAIFAVEAGARDVDAAGSQKFLFGREVQGWKGETAAGASAADDFSRQGERPAEKACGVGDVAFGDFAADDGAGNDFSAEDDRRNDHDFEAMIGAKFGEELYVASLLVAEAKIFTNQDGFYMQIADKDLLNEFSGSEAGKIESKGKDYGSLKAESVEPVHALGIGGEAGRSGLRTKHFARRGIKGESCGDGVDGVSAFDSGAKDCLMAEVDAIEIADGENARVTISCVTRGPGWRRGERGKPGWSSAGHRDASVLGIRVVV